MDFEEAWALAAGLQPTPTCKRNWTAAGGHRGDFVAGCPLAAAILSCKVQRDGWIASHLAIRALFDCGRWESWVTQLVQCTHPPFGLLLGCLLLIRVVVPSPLRFRKFGKCMMNDFNLCLVGMQFGGWRNWIREDPLVHLYRWLRPDLVPLAPCLQCEPHLTLDGSSVPSDPDKIDEEFRKAWLPYFCRSGQRETNLDEFGFEVDGWLPLLPEIPLPRLTVQILADVVLRENVAAGGLHGWGWMEFKVLPFSWFDELAHILSKVEDLGVWPDGLDAYITMIPKTDGDAAPLGQRLLCVLPIVYGIWASARMGQLDGWFESWVHDSVFSAGGDRGSVEAWYASALTWRKFLLVLLIPMSTFLLLMLLSPFTRLIWVFWIGS